MNDRNTLVVWLLSFLLSRRYEPSERVPSERELAGRFKVSRGRLREALAFLEALRVIERRAKSGIYMAGGHTSVDALALFARLGLPLAIGEVQQSVEAHCIHEVAAIRLACARRTDENLNRLRDILFAQAAHVAVGESVAEDDRQFHGELVRATQNAMFARIMHVFDTMTGMQRAVYLRNAARGRQSHGEHVQLFSAVERRHAETAATLLAAHLQGADRYWQDAMAQEGALQDRRSEAVR
jgi:GntR family transcriptional regulator, transcriptional repressor for pyruvate dehydrogenase complex